MPTALWIGLGGAIGSMARYWTGNFVARLIGNEFPWGTLFINVLGSLIIGFVATVTLTEGGWPVSTNMRAFLMAGFCGGFTTFSAYSLQTWDLMRTGDWMAAAGNAVGSVVLCLLAVILGHVMAMRIGVFR